MDDTRDADGNPIQNEGELLAQIVERLDRRWEQAGRITNTECDKLERIAELLETPHQTPPHDHGYHVARQAAAAVEDLRREHGERLDGIETDITLQHARVSSLDRAHAARLTKLEESLELLRPVYAASPRPYRLSEEEMDWMRGRIALGLENAHVSLAIKLLHPQDRDQLGTAAGVPSRK